jgi:hypothetical protein
MIFSFRSLAALVLTLSFVSAASAQTWTPDSVNNVLSTTAKVGAGTASPDARVTIQESGLNQLTFKDGNGTTRFSIFALHSSPYYYELNSSNYELRFTTFYAGGSGGNIVFQTSPVYGNMYERARIDKNGNLGINTNAPRTALHVHQGTAAGSTATDTGIVVATFERTDSAAIGGLSLQGGSKGSGGVGRLYLGNVDEYDSTYIDGGNGRLNFYVRTSPTTVANVLAINASGDLKVQGNIEAKYQDVAEWVPSAKQLPAGTVVVINPDKVNEVMPSARAYDTTVAGVVSAMPGLLLGEAGEAKSKVAATGRVRVRVDATRHPVRTGDLLVTSDKAGVAMVSDAVDVGGVKMHRPGTLIGKALEPLDRGEGEILVLLSLQ